MDERMNLVVVFAFHSASPCFRDLSLFASDAD